MRRLLPALVLVALTAALAACAAPATPNWTYAPAPSVTPAPSGEASGEPSASAEPTESAGATETPEPSETPEASETAEPSGESGLTIAAPVGASTTGFDPTELVAAPGFAFTIEFDNQDTGVVHNFVLKNPDGSNVDIGDTAFFPGPESKTYDVPALDSGAYPFLCEVHPQTMTGTLTIQ